MKCPQPEAPDNGGVDTRGFDLDYQTEIIYNCNDGYILEGSSIGICNENATWGKIPKCVGEIQLRPCSVKRNRSKYEDMLCGVK